VKRGGDDRYFPRRAGDDRKGATRLPDAGDDDGTERYIILEYYARRVAFFFFFAAFANASVAGKLTTRRFQRT